MKHANGKPKTGNLFEVPEASNSKAQGGSLALDNALDRFLAHLEVVRRRALATRDAYRRDLKHFLNFVKRKADRDRVDEIEPRDIYEWMATMRGNSAATVRRRLSAVSAFFRVGMALGYASANPVEQVERPHNRRKQMPVMSDDDVGMLLTAAKRPEEKAVILTFATTGVRRSELAGIRVEDVDLERRRIRIRGKGGKEREVIISPELRQVISAHVYGRDLPDKSPLFPSRTGRPVHHSTLQRRFSRWVERAGLKRKGLTIHSLRRYAATRWLEHGFSVPEIQVLLGHESPETTSRYLNVDLARIQERVSQLPPIAAKVEDDLRDAAGAGSPPLSAKTIPATDASG